MKPTCRPWVRACTAIACVLFAASARLDAQDAPPVDVPPGSRTSTTVEAEAAGNEMARRIEGLGWQRGTTATMNQWAEITVPNGYRFTGGDGARTLLKMFGNLVGTTEQGLLGPETLDWFIVFDFDDCGYVKDDEKDELDADKLLQQKIENSKAANEEKRKRGLPRLDIVGWTVPPHYNSQTNNLEWGIKLRSETGSESVNYNLKLLGRSGVMDATLVCNPDQIDAVLPEARAVLGGFRFQPGQTYAEYRSGDKIAKYGLTALVLGGGAALAAKGGLFAALSKAIAKGGKLLIAGAVAAVAVVVKVFRSLFHRKPTA
jgi:uncharacterized membrane-anchored protein